MPERFLDATGQLDLSKGDPAEFMFGFGRRCVLYPSPGIRVRVVIGWTLDGSRICPGRYFAEASLFMYMASILHAFTIEPPFDAASGGPKRLNHNTKTSLTMIG